MTESTAVVPDAQPAPASTKRERTGWYIYDWADSAFATTVVTVFLGPYLGRVAERAEDSHGHVYVGSVPIAAGSVFAYTVSLSVIIQVFMLPVVGAIADRSSRKKHIMALFAYLGCAATAAMFFMTGTRWQFGVITFLIANVALGASAVIYNSFLPQIAGPDDRDRVSSVGWAAGYIGGGVLLALNLVLVTFHDSFGITNGWTAARLCIVSAAVWWAVFTTVSVRRLENRPATAGDRRGSVVTDGFRQLWHTLKSLRAYPLTIFFLGAFLVYNDGIQTVITLASTYADKQLKLSQSVQVSTILMVQFVAFGGALLMGRIARRAGARKTVLGSLIVWTFALGVAYYLPVGKAGPFFLLGALIGIVLGGSQALSRSIYSQVIPPGKEGEYFGIYEISNNATSWLGPLLFGLAYQITGSYRIAIVSLIVFFAVGFILLAMVPLRRAITQAGNVPPEVL